MQHRNTIECVDELLRKITSIDKPFGGKALLAIGDFRQTAPIVSGAGKSNTIAASIQSSHLWTAFHTLRLHAPIRNAEDIEYAKFVDAVVKLRGSHTCSLLRLRFWRFLRRGALGARGCRERERYSNCSLIKAKNI